MVCQAYYIVWREIMNKQKFHNVMKWIIFVIYMCLLIYVVFFAESMGRTSQTRHIYNLEPFKEIKRFWKYILDNDSLGRIARLNENKWVGGKPALGYKVNKHGKFEIDEEEAIIVKDIFKLRSKGISLAKIGAKYGFSKQKVDYILKNKNYIGVFEYNGKKEKNDIVIEIEPIVSRYMWNKVNLKK